MSAHGGVVTSPCAALPMCGTHTTSSSRTFTPPPLHTQLCGRVALTQLPQADLYPTSQTHVLLLFTRSCADVWHWYNFHERDFTPPPKRTSPSAHAGLLACGTRTTSAIKLTRGVRTWAGSASRARQRTWPSGRNLSWQPARAASYHVPSVSVCW